MNEPSVGWQMLDQQRPEWYEVLLRAGLALAILAALPYYLFASSIGSLWPEYLGPHISDSAQQTLMRATAFIAAGLGVAHLAAYLKRNGKMTLFAAVIAQVWAAWLMVNSHFVLSILLEAALLWALTHAMVSIGFENAFEAESPPASQGPSQAMAEYSDAAVGGSYKAVRPRYEFEDILGMNDVKNLLLRAGREIRSSPNAKNGILLTGDPGNGKTFMAEALAGELGLHIFKVSQGDTAAMWRGQELIRWRAIFRDAERQAPCVMFIDEIDSLLIDRGKAINADSEAVQLVNLCLTRIVDIRAKGVILIAATNAIEKLDGAAIREGRFDYKIEISSPDYDARVDLLRRFAPQGTVYLGPGLYSASKRWEGFSVARIKAIAEQLREVSTPGIPVGFTELSAALRQVQGLMGNALPEDTPTIGDLFYSEDVRVALESIATRMTKIEEMGNLGITAPEGLMFFGPPGTGKSLAAKALAKTTGWAYLGTTGHDLLSSTEEMEKVLRRASDLRPCIVFIDEADDLLASRGTSFTSSATNKFLALMDGGGRKLHDVLFVAATNHKENIDEAMLRGGRFTEKIKFALPDAQVAFRIVENWMKKSRAQFAEDFTPGNVARTLAGQSHANIKAILTAAVNSIVPRVRIGGDSRVSLDDLAHAIFVVTGA